MNKRIPTRDLALKKPSSREILRWNNLTRWRANALWLALLDGKTSNMRLFDGRMINSHPEGGKPSIVASTHDIAIRILNIRVDAVPELGLEAEQRHIFMSDLVLPQEVWAWLAKPQVSGPLWLLRYRGRYVWIEPKGHAPKEVLDGMLALARRVWR